MPTIMQFCRWDAAESGSRHYVAEWAVRMPKVKQKISDGFRTVAGTENFYVIRSCLDTLRKQGHGMFDALQRAFAGNLIQPTA